MIDFELTEEQKMLQRTAREFAEKEMRPIAEEIDADPDPDAALRTKEVIMKGLRLGFGKLLIPERYGGYGGSLVDWSIIQEEFGWGDPGYIDTLKRKARGAKIEFMGKYKPSDVARVFSEIDVLVVPSLWYENSPLVIHEAFATRTPVLASGIGGMAELVADGKGGITFSAGSAEDLACKIQKLAEDESLRSSLARSAPKVKTIEENAQELEETYKRLAATGRA